MATIYVDDFDNNNDDFNNNNNETAEYDYKKGEEARKKMLHYLKYAVVCLILVGIEIVCTEGFAIILAPVTIAIFVILAKKRNVIRGFLGVNQKKQKN